MLRTRLLGSGNGVAAWPSRRRRDALARDALRAKGVDLEDPGNEIGPVGPGSASVGLWFHDLDGYRWELYVEGPDA